MNARPYSSDLTDDEWAILGPLVTPGTQAGHPQSLELRRIVDAALYLLRTGCQCRALPHDLPPWTAVFYHYAKWRTRGTWERINATLRERHRVAKGCKAQPTAAIVDSQSARTTEAGGPRGYDGSKKVSGRKRHILVDTEGNLLKARVHPADIHDQRGAKLLLVGLKPQFPRVTLVWADSAYQGLKPWLSDTLGWTLAISKHWWTGLRGVWVAPAKNRPPSRLAFMSSSDAGLWSAPLLGSGGTAAGAATTNAWSQPAKCSCMRPWPASCSGVSQHERKIIAQQALSWSQE